MNLGVPGQNNQLISQLERDILPLQGIRSLPTDNGLDLGISSIEGAFPNATFPIGCIHEFLIQPGENGSATSGFTAELITRLMGHCGVCLWISTGRTLFPAALSKYGIEPHQVIFIDLKREKDVLYATEEALKCTKLAVVLSEVRNVGFKESRRLQLAAEQSRVTGFLLHHQSSAASNIASVSRWKVSSLASDMQGIPGVGFFRWSIELQKVRNGKPGKWMIEWSAGNFTEIRESSVTMLYEETNNHVACKSDF